MAWVVFLVVEKHLLDKGQVSRVVGKHVYARIPHRRIRRSKKLYYLATRFGVLGERGHHRDADGFIRVVQQHAHSRQCYLMPGERLDDTCLRIISIEPLQQEGLPLCISDQMGERIAVIALRRLEELTYQ
jgi:hypothetical protein